MDPTAVQVGPDGCDPDREDTKGDDKWSFFLWLLSVLPPVLDVIHYSENDRFWPWFQNALGALDGSHFHTAPALEERPNYRNREGFLSQNCLFACSYDFQFVFAYTGWEGSAIDAQVLESALENGFDIPDGYYYLADAGYSVSEKLLTPYRGVRYHLAEWRRADQRYVN